MHPAIITNPSSPAPSVHLSPEETASIIKHGQQATCEIDLALLANGGITKELIAARWPEIDTVALLHNIDSARQVEMLAAHPAIQNAATDMAARRNVNDALAIMRKALDKPECPASVAKDIADLSLKQTARSGEVPKYERRVSVAWEKATVTTFLGQVVIKREGREFPQLLAEVARTARCQDEHELAQVADILLIQLGGISLPGW
jgi:hypothetical protein